jgi:hypothetical protein
MACQIQDISVSMKKYIPPTDVLTKEDFAAFQKALHHTLSDNAQGKPRHITIRCLSLSTEY